MAEKRKAPKTAFKKGQSGNPGGRKPLPDDVKAMKTARNAEFTATLYEYLGMPISELKKLAENCEAMTWNEVMLLRVVERTVDSDMRTINDVWDRAFGKPVQPMEVTGEDGGPMQIIYPAEFKEDGGHD